MIPDNAWGTRITASAGTSLETPYSSHTIRTLSGRKKVYNPKILFLYAASLGHPFGHCRRFPTAASRRSMGRVLVPLWLVIFSNQLPVKALVSRYLTNKLIGRRFFPKRQKSLFFRTHRVLVPISRNYSLLWGRYQRVTHPFATFR